MSFIQHIRDMDFILRWTTFWDGIYTLNPINFLHPPTDSDANMTGVFVTPRALGFSIPVLRGVSELFHGFFHGCIFSAT